MMKRIAASSNDSDARRELFPEMRSSLLAHAHGEEAEFYPQLRAPPELEALVSQCLNEHQRIESGLDELDALDIGSDAWRDQFQRLMEAVESHVEVEEKQLFPKAKEQLDKQQANEMLASYERVEEQEKKRL